MMGLLWLVWPEGPAINGWAILEKFFWLQFSAPGFLRLFAGIPNPQSAMRNPQSS
jgi:hypothetical protein